MDQLQATPIPDTAGAFEPFFSPDCQWIGFFAGGQLKRVSVTGGAAVTLGAVALPFGAWWGDDGTILVGQGPKGILRVPAAGGTPEVLIPVEAGELAHGPQLLPGGEWVLFTLRPAGVNLWNQAQIVMQSLATGERTVLIEGGRDAKYLTTGHLVYARDAALLAVPFDLEARRVTGGPVPLVENIGNTRGSAAQFSVAARNGSLVYVAPGAITMLSAPRTLVWVDRKGRETPLAAPPRGYIYPRLSPDGTRVALDVRAPVADIWLWDLSRETLTRLTFDPERTAPPFGHPTADGSPFRHSAMAVSGTCSGRRRMARAPRSG